MHFFASKKTLDPAKRRQRHIDDLLSKNPRASCIDAARATYIIPIYTIYGQLQVQVCLGPHFPDVAPVVSVLNACTHPWIDQQSRIVHPKLIAWSVHHSLGSILREICEEFSRQPPAPRS